MKVLVSLRWLTLLLLPFLIYGGDIAARYGFRDDYSTLREARDGAGMIMRLNTSHGRPVYGWMLQASFAHLDGIPGLAWGRLASITILSGLAALVAWILERQLAWQRLPAWLVGGFLVTLPACQIYAHWAICWPIALAAVFSALAFAVAHWAWSQNDPTSRVLGTGGAFLLLLLALLDYQPNALLFAALMAAGWIVAPSRPPAKRLNDLARQTALVGATMLTAFGLCQLLFASSLADHSPRFAVETHWLAKLAWVAGQPLQNALALGVLDDDAGRTEPWHLLAAIAVGSILVLHGFLVRRRHGWSAALCWWGGFPGFALLAYAASFLAAEHWPTYRTMLPVSTVAVVYLCHAVGPVAGSGLLRGGLLLPALAGSALLAHHDSHAYLAVEQQAELARLESAAVRLDLPSTRRVLLRLPSPGESTAGLHYLDEFGSRSDDALWCAKEMLLQVLHVHYPLHSVEIEQLQVSDCPEALDPAGADVQIELRAPTDCPPPF